MAADTMVRAVEDSNDLHVTVCCNRRSDVAPACAGCRPDVGVLDASLFDNDPRVAVGSVRRYAPRAGVLLMLSAFDIDSVARALLAGATNCISVLSHRGEFLRATRATARGELLVRPEHEQRLASRLLETREHEQHELSPREAQVLRLAADGLPVAEIARELFISTTTARTHLHRIYGKLGARNRSDAVASAVRAGLIDLT
jgi:DNA-binding NarL/FixJ family response regulator